MKGPISRDPSRRTRETEMPIMQVMRSIVWPEDAIDLSQGIPFFGPPPDALEGTLSDINGLNRYGPDAGDPELREEITEKLHRDNRVDGVSAEQVMVTAGANIGFVNAVSAICDVGDNVILLDPYYFNHAMTLDVLGVEHRHIQAGVSDLPGEISRVIDRRTRAMVIVSPNNPTGEMLDRGRIERLVELSLEKDIWLISDETYERFCFESEHISPASLGKELPVISLFSLSKSHGMSGWRIGYMVHPETLGDSLLKVQDTTVICPSRIGQKLALHCIRDHSHYTDRFLPELDRIRRRLISWTDQYADIIECPHPAGAFYCFPTFRDAGQDAVDSMQLATRILKETGVVLVPGRPFGMDLPPSLRISYGNTRLEQIEEALERLDRWFETNSLDDNREG